MRDLYDGLLDWIVCSLSGFIIVVGTVLLALMLSGCSAAGDKTRYLVAPSGQQTEGPQELLDVLAEASDAWREMGVAPEWIEQIGWMTTAEVKGRCGRDPGDVGYSAIWGCQPGNATIWIWDELPADKLLPVVTHELGHAIARWHDVHGHMSCTAMPGDSLMCRGGSLEGVITEADVEFVLGRAGH